MAGRALLLDRLRAAPARTALLTDFDGTLAPIVDDPAAAAPLDGASDALRDLASRYARVALVSGRPVHFLRQAIGSDVADELWLAGVYGLESADRGVHRYAPGVEEWRPVIDAVAERAAAVFGGLVEHKGLSLTVHFRTAPERAEQVTGWAEAEAVASGLDARRAKASIELHPPVRVDKGTVVDRVTAGMAAACFIGDDLGDLPAFDALDRLAGVGMVTVKVAVATSEAPTAMLERADLVIDGPAAVLALLREL